MRIVLSYQSGVPIYEQIKEQIKEQIISGVLSEEEFLPSIRQLAKELKVSVITTTRAYSDLELEGFVQTIPKKGVFVKKLDQTEVRQQYIAEARTALAEALQCGKTAGLTIEELHQLLDEVEECYDESRN